jgi:hypothetical protein
LLSGLDHGGRVCSSASRTKPRRSQAKAEQLKTDRWFAPSQNLFLFSNRAKFWLIHGNNAEKQLILAGVGSHLSLKAKMLSIDAKNPFRILRERASNSDLLTTVKDVRTFFESNPDFVVPLLPESGVAQLVIYSS